MATRFLVIGGGPAGQTAASSAAALGADVTLIERDVLGGAAHLWDCVPSKAMIATGGELTALLRSEGLGIEAGRGAIDVDALRVRMRSIQDHLRNDVQTLLESQGVRILQGTGRLTSPTTAVLEYDGRSEDFTFDAVLLSTGSRPRIPDWARPDGDRVLTTRDAYPPASIPEHLVVVGSGVTGVEFAHMFTTFGSKVSLVVSRQQVLPSKDPEVAAVLEASFLERGVELHKGARATGIRHEEDGIVVECHDGRMVRGSHALLAIGSIPNSDSLGLEAAGLTTTEWGTIPIDHNCLTAMPGIYVAGDLSGKLPLSSVASMQGRKIAEHAMGLHAMAHRHLDYDKAASAIFTVPEIADVGLAEADAFASGRKIRVTKVPFAANAKALISGDPRGFVKVISDPATGVVLGGSIVGEHAAELISVLAVAVTNGLRTQDIVESLLVHPSLAEAIVEASF
jgi:dihydrolipoamide dehydrogenase